MSICFCLLRDYCFALLNSSVIQNLFFKMQKRKTFIYNINYGVALNSTQLVYIYILMFTLHKPLNKNLIKFLFKKNFQLFNINLNCKFKQLHFYLNIYFHTKDICLVIFVSTSYSECVIIFKYNAASKYFQTYFCAIKYIMYSLMLHL